MLREEGGYEYKKAIVNTIISIIEENPEAKEAGMKLIINFSVCYPAGGHGL
jgi:coatomer protein complex subunit gamma